MVTLTPSMVADRVKVADRAHLVVLDRAVDTRERTLAIDAAAVALGGRVTRNRRISQRKIPLGVDSAPAAIVAVAVWLRYCNRRQWLSRRCRSTQHRPGRPC